MISLSFYSVYMNVYCSNCPNINMTLLRKKHHLAFTTISNERNNPRIRAFASNKNFTNARLATRLRSIVASVTLSWWISMRLKQTKLQSDNSKKIFMKYLFRDMEINYLLLHSLRSSHFGPNYSTFLCRHVLIWVYFVLNSRSFGFE